jgi:nitrite reductase (NADH) large subunit
MCGARVEQLPAIWRRLVDAGFESGHAYGKALRTVKSCVGTTWCRFGEAAMDAHAGSYATSGEGC